MLIHAWQMPVEGSPHIFLATRAPSSGPQAHGSIGQITTPRDSRACTAMLPKSACHQSRLFGPSTPSETTAGLHACKLHVLQPIALHVTPQGRHVLDVCLQQVEGRAPSCGRFQRVQCRPQLRWPHSAGRPATHGLDASGGTRTNVQWEAPDGTPTPQNHDAHANQVFLLYNCTLSDNDCSELLM